MDDELFFMFDFTEQKIVELPKILNLVIANEPFNVKEPFNVNESIHKNRRARIIELKLLREEYCERWGPDSGLNLSIHLIRAKEKDILEMDKEIQFLESK